jgi:predicted RNA-binding protein YlqC (UPF0109 family)
MEHSGEIEVLINRGKDTEMVFDVVIDERAVHELGRLFGRDGQTMAAINRIMVAAAGRYGIARISINIINPFAAS